MWEWSNQNQFKKPQETTSLLNAYDDLAPAAAPPNLTSSFSAVTEPEILNNMPVPSMSEMERIIEEKLRKYNLRNIRLIKKDYTPQTWQEMYSVFSEYQRMRNAFLKLIGYSDEAECRKLGLNDEDIALLKTSITPENFNTHLKIPFDFGGNLNISNFSLIKTHHCHSNIHRILDMQISSGFLLKHKKIFIPWFEGKFYYD